MSGPEEYSHISKITPIGEKEKERQGIPGPPVSPFKKKFSFVYHVIQVLLSLFPRGSLQGALKDLSRDLRDIKILFHKLQLQDLSESPEFLEELKIAWENFIKHFQSVSLSPHPLLKKIRTLFDEIHAYPNTFQFSLGYYLSHYAGEEWIPFPYMEILKNLHTEALADIEKGTLAHWILEIDEIIRLK